MTDFKSDVLLNRRFCFHFNKLSTIDLSLSNFGAGPAAAGSRPFRKYVIVVFIFWTISSFFFYKSILTVTMLRQLPRQPSESACYS